MAILTFNGETFTVDHAVKGADYIHGYDAAGTCLIAIDGITDFSAISYDGTYMNPTECLDEINNEVRYVGDKFVLPDGTVVMDPSDLDTGLPDITESDNGKFVQVVNGAYALVSLAVYTGETEDVT